MKPLLRILLVATTAMMFVTGAMAQQTKPGAPPTAPKGAKPANPHNLQKPATPAPAGEKFWGSVTKDPMKDNTFTMGSSDKKRLGTFTIDAKGARVTDKSGKFVSLKSLTPGSTVMIMGSVKGKVIKATTIQITFLRPASTSSAAPAKPPKPAKGGGTIKP